MIAGGNKAEEKIAFFTGNGRVAHFVNDKEIMSILNSSHVKFTTSVPFERLTGCQ